MKKVLIKCGGSIIDELTPSFFESLRELEKDGYQLLFVHGGGPDINKTLDLYKVPHEFENGLRKTTAQAMEIVEMVLAGNTNRKLVAKLNAYGIKAFGLNGSDGSLLQGDFINEEKLGFVGDIKHVNSGIITMLQGEQYTPVITPIAVTESGTKLNINADFAAAAIANALQVDHCVFVTDVDGILIDGELAPKLSIGDIKGHINGGQITGGMVPKVNSAIKALSKGLQSVWIVSGKSKFYDESNWIGTKIYVKEGIMQ